MIVLVHVIVSVSLLLSNMAHVIRSNRVTIELAVVKCTDAIMKS